MARLLPSGPRSQTHVFDDTSGGIEAAASNQIESLRDHLNCHKRRRSALRAHATLKSYPVDGTLRPFLISLEMSWSAVIRQANIIARHMDVDKVSNSIIDADKLAGNESRLMRMRDQLEYYKLELEDYATGAWHNPIYATEVLAVGNIPQHCIVMVLKLSEVRNSTLCFDEYRDEMIVPWLEQKLAR